MVTCSRPDRRKVVAHVSTVHTPFDNRIFKKECVSLARADEYDVYLVCSIEREQVIEGVRLISIRQWRNRALRMVFGGLQAFFRTLRLKPDVVHFHDPEFIPFALLLTVFGHRVIYDVHEDYTSSIEAKRYLPSSLRRFLSRIVDRLERIVAQRCEIVIAEKYYARRFPQATPILNYPDLSRITNAITRRGTEQLGLIYTGNVTIDRGAREHARLAALLPDIPVTMVGLCSPSLADELRFISKGARNLTIRGVGEFIQFDEIVQWYARGRWIAGLALFPVTRHYKEKELTKFFEYMAAGLPIICTDTPVWRSLIADNGVGICVPEGCEASVIAAVSRLAADDKLREQMGSRGRHLVATQFNWDTQERRLRHLYSSILRRAA